MPGYWNAHSDRDYEDQGREPPGELEEDGPDPSEECGRWRNGSLAAIAKCLSAGTEFCQIECPMRGDR